MRTENICNLELNRIMGEVSCEKNWFKPQVVFLLTLPSGVPLLQFIFVCVFVVSYLELVRSLFVHHLALFWYLGTVVRPDCGIF